MVRQNDMIPSGTPWLHDTATQRVCRLVSDAGFQVYFVGGCVRDALLGRDAGDIDLTTNAHPRTVMDLAQAAGIKAVPTGIDHGTVTVVVKDQPFEITTFRKDVETDGRRAVVAFADCLHEDAQRRDFTMNALYATPEGAVIDPVGGLPDLAGRHIRFIGNASDRICEDYLRTLRFFRFQAWFGDESSGPDPDALDAIAQNLSGLETLSAERIGVEIRKLLAAPDPSPALAAMRQTGVLQMVLPGADDRWMAPLVHAETQLSEPPDGLSRLVALGGEGISDRLRLSRSESKQYDLIRDMAFSGPSLAAIAYRHGAKVATGSAKLRSVMAEQPIDIAVLETIRKAASQVFPIKPSDLMPKLSGPALGMALRTLETAWIDSDFCLSRDALLRKLGK